MSHACCVSADAHAGMGTAAGADELVEIPAYVERPLGTKAHPLHPSTSLERKRS